MAAFAINRDNTIVFGGMNNASLAAEEQHLLESENPQNVEDAGIAVELGLVPLAILVVGKTLPGSMPDPYLGQARDRTERHGSPLVTHWGC